MVKNFVCILYSWPLISTSKDQVIVYVWREVTRTVTTEAQDDFTKSLLFKLNFNLNTSVNMEMPTVSDPCSEVQDIRN